MSAGRHACACAQVAWHRLLFRQAPAGAPAGVEAHTPDCLRAQAWRQTGRVMRRKPRPAHLAPPAAQPLPGPFQLPPEEATVYARFLAGHASVNDVRRAAGMPPLADPDPLASEFAD